MSKPQKPTLTKEPEAMPASPTKPALTKENLRRASTCKSNPLPSLVLKLIVSVDAAGLSHAEPSPAGHVASLVHLSRGSRPQHRCHPDWPADSPPSQAAPPLSDRYVLTSLIHKAALIPGSYFPTQGMGATVHDESPIGDPKVWKTALDAEKVDRDDVQAVANTVVRHVTTTLARQAANIDELGAYQATALSVRDQLLK